MYEVTRDIGNFCMINDFTKLLEKVAYSLGQQLKPISLFNTDIQNKHKVIDLTILEGLSNPSVTLLQDIFDYWSTELFNDNYINLEEVDELTKKAVFIDYLLNISICYIELPKSYEKGGVKKVTYDKYIATKNSKLLSIWEDISEPECYAKYTKRIVPMEEDLRSGCIKLAKLSISDKKGVSISVPRNKINVENMKCMPIFMVNNFLKGIYPYLENGMLEILYAKDNNTERDMVTTLNMDIVNKYYGKGFTDMVSESIEFIDNIEDEIFLIPKQNRGYIRVPELGCSRYDKTGVRSINIARILEMKQVQGFNTEFVDIDLDAVIGNFEVMSEGLCIRNKEEFMNMVYTLCSVMPKIDDTSHLMSMIRVWISNNNSYHGTVFKRYLHNFMLSNPQWFKGYTGKRTLSTNNNDNLGV